MCFILDILVKVGGKLLQLEKYVAINFETGQRSVSSGSVVL